MGSIVLPLRHYLNMEIQMSRNLGAGGRVVKASQGLGYSLLTVGAGVTTFAMGTATAGLAMTGVGIPLAALTAAGTGGCGYGTFFFGKKTGHKFARAFQANHHEHTHHETSTKKEYQVAPLFKPFANGAQAMASLSGKHTKALVNPADVEKITSEESTTNSMKA